MDEWSANAHNGVKCGIEMSCAVLLFAFVLISSEVVCGNDADLRRIDAINTEQPCLRAGGICTIASDCPDGNLSEQRGLCPNQRSQGIECCYGISTKETRCSKHGGVCMPNENFCNFRLVFHGALDCKGDTRCCIMI